MPRKRTSPEEIIHKLREAEILVAQGQTVREAAKQIGVTEQTYYRWRNAYGGMVPNQARRLKEQERENTRLKKLVADQALDNQILQFVRRPFPRSGCITECVQTICFVHQSPLLISANCGSCALNSVLVLRCLNLDC